MSDESPVFKPVRLLAAELMWFSVSFACMNILITKVGSQDVSDVGLVAIGSPYVIEGLSARINIQLLRNSLFIVFKRNLLFGLNVKHIQAEC